MCSQNSADVKVIDFGSACFEDQTVYTYIQSRFYRSPEVLIGNPYNSSIDTWSVGCIAAELYLGLPLFPGINEFDQICRIVEMLGIPPMSMLKMGKNTSKYFVSQSDEDGANFSFRLKSRDEFAKETNTTAITSKRYFRGCTLNEVIFKYSYSKELNVKEKKQGKCFFTS